MGIYDIKPERCALAESKGIYKCLSCFACVERCPRDVQPGRVIDAARQLVVRQRGGNHAAGAALCCGNGQPRQFQAFYCGKGGQCNFGIHVQSSSGS